MTTKTKKDFSYESIEPGYYDGVYHKGCGAQSKWHHLKFKYVQEQLGKYTNHLDVGCGPGTFIGRLDNKFSSVGVDISQNQIDYANSKYKVAQHSFVQMQAGKSLPFEAQTFDVVTLIEVIEHLKEDDIRNFFEEINRVLKPGGRILMTTPNYASIWPMIEKIVDRLSPLSYEEQHLTFFTKKRLSRFLNQFSYTEVRVDAFQFLAPFYAIISWKLANVMTKFEHPLLAHLFGLLLFAEVKKDN